MGNWLGEALGGAVGETVAKIGDTVKKFVTTDKDKPELELRLKEIENGFIVKIAENANAYEEQITQRHSADMASDSRLSKNIRPLTLIFILAMYSLCKPPNLRG